MTLDKKTYFLLLTFIVIFYIIYTLLGFNSTYLEYKTIISDNTMGTTYSITIIDSTLNNDNDLLIELKSSIDSILVNINNHFSQYVKLSEINKINNSTQIKLSSTFTDLYIKALKYCKLSNGRYDITVSPLIKLWGFSDYNYNAFPLSLDIQKVLEYVGYDKIKKVLPKYKGGKLTQLEIKKNIKTEIDLNSIAKGYAVDVLYDYLNKYNCDFTNYLIEIGGEVRSKNNKDKKWLIGVQNPLENALIKTINLDNYSLATSGTYNNYFEKDGIEYSHIINPITGYPIKNNIVSVSVISEKCVDADALATMLMVMDWKDGMNIINNISNTECLIILKSKDNRLSLQYSKGFLDFTID